MAPKLSDKSKIGDYPPDRRMDLSFSGAGFMGVYYFGVVDCWNRYIPRDRVRYVTGASAGSLIAAYYLMDLPMNECMREIIAFGEAMRSRTLGAFDRNHQVVDELPQILDRIFPADAHKRASGRLHIVMTRLKDMKKIVVNEFETRQDLIDALNCSCFIPVWSGNHVSTYKGVKHIDGGFRDNLPIFDEHTIRICSFSGGSDIAPYDRVKSERLSSTIQNTPVYINWANLARVRKALFPPPASVLCDLLEQGFMDTKQFILGNDLIQCEKCYRTLSREQQPIYSKMSPTISPAITPRSISPAQSTSDLSSPAELTQLSMSTDGHLTASNLIASKLSKKDRKFGSLLKDKLQKCSSESAFGLSTIKAHEEDNYGPTVAPSIVITNETQLEEGETGRRLRSSSGTSSESGVVNSSTNECDDNDDDDDDEDESDLGDKTKRKKRQVKLDKRQSLSNIIGLKRSDKFLARRRQTVANLADEEEPTTSSDDLDSENLAPNTLSVSADRFKPVSSPLPSCPPSPSLSRRCVECARLRQQARNDLVEESIKQEVENFRKFKPPTDSRSLMGKIAHPIKWIRQLNVSKSYTFDADAIDARRASIAL